jgi:hypothetical protein
MKVNKARHKLKPVPVKQPFVAYCQCRDYQQRHERDRPEMGACSFARGL